MEIPIENFDDPVRLRAWQLSRSFSHNNKVKKEFLHFFTTDESLSKRAILAIYSYCWSIEILFKYAKQSTGLVAYQYHNEEAVGLHLQFTLIAYALLTHLLIDEKRLKCKRLTKKLK